MQGKGEGKGGVQKPGELVDGVTLGHGLSDSGLPGLALSRVLAPRRPCSGHKKNPASAGRERGGHCVAMLMMLHLQKSSICQFEVWTFVHTVSVDLFDEWTVRKVRQILPVRTCFRHRSCL